LLQFPVGGPAPSDNEVVDNIVVGNTIGIRISAGTKGNVVLKNLAVGNPPVQVSVTRPLTTEVDILNLAAPGDNIVEGNVCLTTVNAACAIFGDSRSRR
jgi:parallel beta-helix repeat protein